MLQKKHQQDDDDEGSTEEEGGAAADDEDDEREEDTEEERPDEEEEEEQETDEEGGATARPEARIAPEAQQPPGPATSTSDEREQGKVGEECTCLGGVRVVVSRSSLTRRWHGCGCGGRRVGSIW